MILIITGDDTISINEQKRGDSTDHVLYDRHLKDIFAECKNIIEKYSNTDIYHRVFTYNINAIQALFYFARKLGKREPQVIYYHNDDCEVIDLNHIDKVYDNLIEPVDQLFLGKL